MPGTQKTLIVAGLAAALLVACSGGDKPAETKAPAATAAATTAAGTTAAASTAAPKATASAAATGGTAAGGTGGTGAAPRVSNISNFKLESFTVKAGTTVQWISADGPDAPHQLVGDKGEFDSKTPIAASGFRFTFDKPGVIAYHCAIHPTMTGAITVQ